LSNLEDSQANDFSPRKDLYQIFGSTALSKRQKIKVIGNLDEVYGYDLVFIIYLILENGLSGYLNIVNQNNEISGIVFSNGKIVKIDLLDRDTLFGQMLIQEGYVSLEQLNKLIQSNSASLGEQLINNKIISKEQFIELLLKQMRLRLSKYINQMMYRINFVENDESNTLFSIDQNQYLSLAHDWIAGRFETKWLSMHYLEFLNTQFIIKESELSASEMKDLPLVKIFYDKKKLIGESTNLEVLLTALKSTSESDIFLKSMHFLIIAGFAQFVENQQQAEDKSKSFIQKIYSNMVKKSEVDMLESVASILKMKPTDIDGIYNEINRAIERSSSQADEEIKIELSRLSLDILSRKKHYLDHYNKAHLKTAGQPEVDKQLIEQIKLDLLQKNFYSAMNKLNKLKNLENQTPKIRLYLIWTRVASAVYNKVYVDQKSIDRELIQILPEDKNSPDFYYVMSLLAKLKNDKPDVTKYFAMASKMDSTFEGFPLADESLGDKFKKMFAKKNSIVFLLIFFSYAMIYAQENPLGEGLSLDGANPKAPESESVESAKSELASEPDSESETIETKKIDPAESEEAQTEMYSQDTLPFSYLNQYFTYEAVDGGKVILNEKEFNFVDIELVREKEMIRVNLKGEWTNILKKGRVALLDADLKPLSSYNFELKENQLALKDLVTAQFICFQVRSRYSNLKVCKNMLPSDNERVESVLANDSKLSSKGQIVVQDSQKRSYLKINFENMSSFFFDTIRRKAYPAIINKARNSDELKVRFVDLDMQTLAWLATLRIDQQFFEIKMDPLIQLRQDILFSDPGLKAKAISKTLIKKKQITVIAKNKFTLSPMIGYSQLVGENPDLNVKLRTGMGLGASLQYSQNFQSRWDWYLQAHFLSTKILFEDETIILSGINQSLYQVSLGALFHWQKNWDFTFGGGVRNDMFMKPININDGVEVFTTLNEFVTIGLDYGLIKGNFLELGIPFNIKFNLPGQIAGLNSYLGLQYEMGALASYRLSWGRIFGTLMYGTRKQNYGDFNYKEDYYYINTGLMYLF
jgi:hypothetical protein